MIRRLAFELLLFLVPFAVYGAYWRLMAADEKEPARKHPWTFLFASGLVLVTASFIVLGLVEGSSIHGVYVPPQLVKGEVVPGHVQPAGAAQ
jgi:hypothetical protein